MNWLDMLLVVVLAWSVGAGLARGFSRTVIGIAAAILAIALATWFYASAGSFFVAYVSSPAVSNFIGFTLIFLAVLLAGALLAHLMARFFKLVGMGWLDRLLGGCLGLFRGLLVAIAVVMLLMGFSVNPPPQAVVESNLAPYVIDSARVLAYMAPRELTSAVHDSYDKIRNTWSLLRQPPNPKK